MSGPQYPKRHIVFSGRTQPLSYTSPNQRRNRLTVADRNRSEHGNAIKERLQAIQQQNEEDQNVPIEPGVIREDGVYVEFISEFNFQLAFDSFEDGRSGTIIYCDVLRKAISTVFWYGLVVAGSVVLSVK